MYRGAEAIKTKRMRLDVHAGETRVGRLASNDAVVFSGSAGTYLLDTSMPGTQPLAIDLKPGQVHYVQTRIHRQKSEVV